MYAVFYVRPMLQLSGILFCVLLWVEPQTYHSIFLIDFSCLHIIYAVFIGNILSLLYQLIKSLIALICMCI